MSNEIKKVHDYKVIGEELKDGKLESIVVESKMQYNVPYGWLEFCSNCDMFRSGYIGYWAYGYKVGSNDEAPEETSQEKDFSDSGEDAKAAIEEHDFHADVLNMDKTPWILVEDEDETQSRMEKEARARLAEIAYRNKEELPEGCYVMTRELAIKAFVMRAQRQGPDWFEDADGSDYDCAIQAAIFDEVKYG